MWLIDTVCFAISLFLLPFLLFLFFVSSAPPPSLQKVDLLTRLFRKLANTCRSNLLICHQGKNCPFCNHRTSQISLKKLRLVPYVLLCSVKAVATSIRTIFQRRHVAMRVRSCGRGFVRSRLGLSETLKVVMNFLLPEKENRPCSTLLGFVV